MLYICDHSGYAYAACIKNKSDAPEVAEHFVKEIRRKCGVHFGKVATPDNKIIIAGIRSDNEPALKSTDWSNVLDRLCIQQEHSVPYEPQGNGTCERLVQSVKDSLRTCMAHVDSRLWDFAIKNIIQCWNMRNSEKATLAITKQKRKITKCPNDVLKAVSSNPLVQGRPYDREKYLRRFGCLCYFKPHIPRAQAEKNSPLLPKRERGVYLGLSEVNSAWLVGVFRAGHFHVYETRNAVFLEDVIVNNVEDLSSPDPPLMQQILTRLDRLARENLTAGEPKGSAGVGGDYRLKGLEVSEYSDGVSGEIPTHDNLVESLKLAQRHMTPFPDKVEGQEPDHLEIGDEIDDGQSLLESRPVINKVNARKIPPTSQLGTRVTPSPIGSVGSQPSELNQDSTPNIGESIATSRTGADLTTISSDTPGSTVIGGVDQSVNGVQQSSSGSPDVTYGPSTVVNIRRGRPKGQKDVKKRNRRTKKQMQDFKNRYQETCSFLIENGLDHAEAHAHLAFDPKTEHEEILEADVFLHPVVIAPSQPGDSVKPGTAFHPDNPERPKWVEAKTLEQVRLEAYKCWRELTDEEKLLWRQGKIQAVPCALLLNRKRCGRFKARLVVLGNRWKPNAEDNSVYASVVSQVGNRCAMVQIAKAGFTPVPFDISNAFIRASMGGTRVCVKLPETFRDPKNPSDDGKRMLLKALYGLPISPRLWAKTLSKDLAKLGWTECPHEPGVWTLREENQIVGFMTVYVDDCILACNTPEKTAIELDKVHKLHPLSIITTEKADDGTLSFDMTGVDVSINPRLNTLKINMTKYTKKLLKRFDVPLVNDKGDKVKGLTTPAFPEENLYGTDSIPSKFPFRECVGALSWLATNVRPDIAHATNMLARASSLPVTKSMAKCCRIVMKYLIGTIDQSIEYSPKLEKDFEKRYLEVAKHADNAKVKEEQLKNGVTTFTDASFGVTYKEMKSISGVVIYLYGTPVAWSSKVQTVFASSTTESEWIAMSDGIMISESVFQLFKFLVGDDKREEGPLFCDNRGATISARVEDITDIAKKTRHVALKFSKVRTARKRIWFCPTTEQKADGLTKSGNAAAMRMIFESRDIPYIPQDSEENVLDFETPESESWASSFIILEDHIPKLSKRWELQYVEYVRKISVKETK
jgi:hypothetical protein